MAHIFFSYARKDNRLVDRLRDDLTAHGFDHWVDATDATVGTPSYQESVRQAIQGSRAVVWVVSPSSLASPSVRTEISIGEEHGCKIIPVWAEGEVWENCVPFGMGKRLYVDMRGARYDKGLRELINALNRQFLEGVGNLEAVAPLPQLAQPLRPSQDARDFPAPDHERLYRELAQPETTHERRREIGDLLALRGDTRVGVGVKDGIPEIAWVEVPGTNGAKVSFGKMGEFELQNFYLSTYLVTHAQFQAFVEADDGYHNLTWWKGFPDDFQPQRLREAQSTFANAPRDRLSWYQCVAFTRWLDARLRRAQRLPHDNFQVRLPTEWEWQWATQNGAEKRNYPWGDKWLEGRANSAEARLSRTTAVGMYPHGGAVCGALDMSGNLREWCLNDYKDYTDQTVHYELRKKVLRGGAFNLPAFDLRSTLRFVRYPADYGYSFGFRCAYSQNSSEHPALTAQMF